VKPRTVSVKQRLSTTSLIKLKAHKEDHSRQINEEND
jgi:hypothetical protein